MRYAHTLTLLLAATALGCGDGCACGGDPQAPVVPESAGATDEFDPATAGSTPSAGAVVEAVVDEELEAEVELEAEPEPSVQDPNIPHQIDPNQHIQALQPPTMQLRPVTPGAGGNLPNRVSPSITNQQVRQAGPTPGSVDPEFITE